MSNKATPPTQASLDLVRLAIVQSGLVTIAREMGTMMARASYSSILNEGKDFSCAIFNADGELVAEGEFVLVHLAAMHEAVQVLIKRFHEQWQPGDIAIHNDPYDGGSHLPDINLLRPVFLDSAVIGYVATRAHYPDVGGRVPGSFSGEAESLFEEGVVIPPLLLARGDQIDDQLVALWSRNVRVARRLRADLLAQVASVRLGERRLLELVDRYGQAGLSEVMSQIPEHGEAVMRSRIRSVLSGSAEYFDYMDDAGSDSTPVRIHLRVSVMDDEVTFDYRQSDPQVACPINAPAAVVKSATYGAMKCLLVPDLPLNSGMFRPISVLTTPGTVTHPVYPAPVAAGNTNTSQRLFDMCLAVADHVTTDGTGGMAASYSANSDLGIGGQDDHHGEFVLYMMPVGGIGARPESDGENALINYMGNCASQPVEVFESMYPIRLTRYCLRPDSGGPGRRRGGLGLSVEYVVRTGVLQASLFTERQRFPPFGLREGQPALPGVYTIRRGNSDPTPILTKTSGLWLREGDVLTIDTAGGGGYGDPFLREPDRVVADVREGLVSRASALEAYGILIDDAGDVTTDDARRSRSSAVRSQIHELVVVDIDEDDEYVFGVPASIESGTTQTHRPILFCYSASSSIYAQASIAPDNGAVIGATIARVLGVAIGEHLFVRVLETSWEAHSTDALRRRFSIERLYSQEMEDQ